MVGRSRRTGISAGQTVVGTDEFAGNQFQSRPGNGVDGGGRCPLNNLVVVNSADVFCSDSKFCRTPALKVMLDMVLYPSGYRPYWLARAVRSYRQRACSDRHDRLPELCRNSFKDV